MATKKPGGRGADKAVSAPSPAPAAQNAGEDALRDLAVRERARDLALYAGAGSGKTSLLVGRYLSLVTEDRVPPGEILAITFTVRAAAEMRERVVAELRARGLEAERRAAERAEITTIHGFCAALLREHFFLAGVDPEFRVPTEVETGRFLDSAFAAHFRKKDPGFFELVARHGEDFVRGAVLDLVRQEQSLGYGSERLAALAADLASERARRRAEFDRRRADVPRCAAGALRGLLEEKLSGKSAEKLAAARECLAGLEAGRCEAATLEALDENTSRLLKLSPEGKARLAELRAALARLADFSEAAWGAELESERHRRALYAVAAATLGEFAGYKSRRGLVDYEDMQRLARALLRDQPGVAAALARRYRHILVDEFQDTNRLQKEMVDLLRADVPGKLFAVGDERQSIYRFRHAEVEVFRRHVAETRGGGGVVVELARNFRSRPELLAFTGALFGRLRPDEFPPLEAAARYESRMPAPAVELLLVEQGEEGLAQARWDEADRLAAHVAALVASGVEVFDREKKAHRPIEFRDVAVLCRTRGPFAALERSFAKFGVPAEAPGGREFYDRVEITDLVSLLGWLADPGDDAAAAAVLRSPFFDLSDDGLFWLAQGGSLAGKVERCLGVSPCPGSPISGGGGSRSEETRSVSSRGPNPQSFGRQGIGGKTEIHALRPAAAGHEFEPPPPEIGELSSSDLAAVQSAARLLSEARRMAGHSSAAAVIEFVAAETGYFEKILARRRGLAEHANLRRFVAEAERFSAHSGGLAAAADYFRRARAVAAAAAEGESGSAVEPGQAVSILTIHASKGLEFPVVAVADLGRETGGGHSRGAALDADLGMGLKLADEFGEKTGTAGATLVALKLAEADAAEEDRLLYVAMTRARERLILSGVSKLDEPGLAGRRHIDRIRAALELQLPVAGSQLSDRKLPTDNCQLTANLAGVSVALPPAVAPGSGRRLVTLAEKLGDGFDPTKPVKAPKGLEPSAADRAAAELVAKRLAAPAVEAGGALDARVTELAEMDGCPRRHVLERLAALDGAHAAPDADAAEPPEIVHAPGGAELGSEVHELLERMDFGTGAVPGSEFRVPRSRGRGPGSEPNGSELETRNSELGTASAAKLVEKFLQSETAARLGRAQSDGRLLREAELHLRLGESLISGSADVLVLEGGTRESPERVFVLDYKTDRDAAADPERARRRHELQVRLYALAARRAWPGAKVEAAIAFLSADRLAPVTVDDAALAAAEHRAGELLRMLAGAELELVRGELCEGCPEAIRAGCEVQHADDSPQRCRGR